MSSSSIRRVTSFEPDAVRPRKAVQRRTSFATISVREYEQTIGDSPTCLEGAPISLSWTFREGQDIPFEEYEQARQPCRRRRSELVLGVQERRNKLVQSGVPISDVLRAESLVTLKKSSSRMSTRRTSNVNDRLHAKVANKKTNLSSLKELEQKEPPKRTSPPLQKQLASRAA